MKSLGALLALAWSTHGFAQGACNPAPFVPPPTNVVCKGMTAQTSFKPMCPKAMNAASFYQGVPPTEKAALMAKASGGVNLAKSGNVIGQIQTNETGDAATLGSAAGKLGDQAGKDYGQCAKIAEGGLNQLQPVFMKVDEGKEDPFCQVQAEDECKKLFEQDIQYCQKLPPEKQKECFDKAKEAYKKCIEESSKQCIQLCAMSAEAVERPAKMCEAGLQQLQKSCAKDSKDTGDIGKDTQSAQNHIGDMLKGMQMPELPKKDGGGDKKKKDDKKDTPMPAADGNPTAAYTPPEASTPNDLGLTDWESSETPTAMEVSAANENMHNLVGDKQELLTSTPAEKAAVADFYAKNNTLLKTTPGNEKLDPETGVAKPGEEAGGGAPVDFTAMGGGGAASALGSLFPSNSLNGGLSLTDGAGNLFGVGDLGSLQPVITDSTGNVMREATPNDKVTAIIAKINERDGHAFEKLELLRKSKGLKVSVVDEGKGRAPAADLAK